MSPSSLLSKREKMTENNATLVRLFHPGSEILRERSETRSHIQVRFVDSGDLLSITNLFNMKMFFGLTYVKSHIWGSFWENIVYYCSMLQMLQLIKLHNQIGLNLKIN